MKKPLKYLVVCPNQILSRSDGFTLVELVLATLISTLVIGILSVALTFSMKMWERQRDRAPSEFPMIVELMALQMANFDSTALPSELGASKRLFIGDEHSLTIATDYSVKALSAGIPIVARYLYEPAEKVLYYAEIPMDPYHYESLRDFLAMKPGDKSTWPRFFPIEVKGFSLSYSAEGEEDYAESWTEEQSLPKAVLIKWTVGEDSFSRLLVPDLLFPNSEQTKNVSAISGAK